MTAARRESSRREGGLALAPLVAVALIVGLLAAIVIPLYIDQNKKARDTAAKSDLTAVAESIRAAVEEGQVDPPTLAVSGTSVTLDGKAVATLSPGVVLGSLQWVSFDDWCIDLIQPAGKHSAKPGYKFEGPDGETKTGQCT